MATPEVLRLAARGPIVCAVADGMGGQAAGAVASRRVVQRLVNVAPTLGDEDAVVGCLRTVNTELFAEMDRDPSTRGMGTTVAGIVFLPPHAVVFNVGDSRVYRSQDGFLRQLTVDDRPTPGSHRLTQALGGADDPVDVEPHVRREPLHEECRYLICSDGLTDGVDIDGLEACMVDDDVKTVERLFERAMEAGGLDNISVILVRVESGGGDSILSQEEEDRHHGDPSDPA
jgi:protein phosphatase